MNYSKNYDVIVGGAGIAGIAAAIELSRSGMKTALIEKNILPGGLATAGMVNIYLPLCDGNGNQLIFGIAEELLKMSVDYSPISLPMGWGNKSGAKISRYTTKFSPASFTLALDEILEKSGVDLWYDTLICDVKMKKNTLEGVIVENKSGRGLLSAKCIIDATGDADISSRAGVELEDGNNKLSIWGLEASLEKAKATTKYDDPEMLLNMVRLGADDRGVGHPKESKTWSGCNGKNVTEFILASRKLMRNHYDSNDKNTSFPLSLPTIAQFRTTRKIVGRDKILNKNVNIKIPNSIANIPDWRTSGKVWQLPYGALLPKKVDGLLVAGRIISAEDGDAWSVSRVIPAAALTGQLAGKAAAISISKNIPLKDINPKSLIINAS